LAIGGFLTLKKVYSFDPVPEELNEVQSKHILGGQGNVWTEFIATPEHAEYMAVPRMTALAEVLWSRKDDKDWDNFLLRLQKQLRRFDQMNVNYSKGSWKVSILPVMENGIYKVELESEQYNVPVRYTLDGSEPTVESDIYKTPLIIDRSTVIKAGLFVEGKLMEYISEKEIVFHKGVGKNCYLQEPPDKKYPARGAISLVDGLKGSDSYRDGYWLGFEGKDMDFEIDLGKVEKINFVSASFYQNTGAWIFMPEKVIFEILDSDKKTIAKDVLSPDATSEVKGVIIEDIRAEFDSVAGRYIKVHAKNIKTIPAWHEGAGNKAWIFADEVVVE
jgi:hexosaminidase